MQDGAAYYLKRGGACIIKLVGDIRYTMGCALGDFLDDLFARADCDDIVVDMTQTRSIDSTSLGLLARIANFSRSRFAHKTTLLSTNPDVNQVLDTVGFYDIFIVQDSGEIIAETLQQLATQDPCKEELTRVIFEAHRTLSELNPRNREAFKSVVDGLRAKLERG